MSLLDRFYLRDAPRWHMGEPYHGAGARGRSFESSRPAGRHRSISTSRRCRRLRRLALGILVPGLLAGAVMWGLQAGYIIPAPHGTAPAVVVCAQPHCVTFGPGQPGQG